MKELEQGFKPSWWAKNRHIQTMWGPLIRRLPKVPNIMRERLELDDGDFIDLDIYKVKNRPTLLLLHGLEGSIDSAYIRGMLDTAVTKNWQVVVMHFRSCSGEPNRLLSSYNSGVSSDLQLVLNALAKQSLNVDYIVGYSLGGNVLLKWLGEKGRINNSTKESVNLNMNDYSNIKAAVAVSVPMLLDVCAKEIHTGFSRVYEWALLQTLRHKTSEKILKFGSDKLPQLTEVSKLNSFVKFDNQVTAPAHGYKNAEDYYQKASAQQFIKSIKIPTLIVHAKDDPFMNESVIPDQQEISESVTLEVNEKGGHVGFVQGQWPWKAEYYLEKRIPEYLQQFS